MKELTLAEHCRAFYEERGAYQPLLGTPEGDMMYRMWVEWAFSNMSGKTPQAQAQAMKDIEEMERRR
jgi:hypothetical protein